MKILIITKSYGGNFTTASRIRSHFAPKHTVCIKESFNSNQDFLVKSSSYQYIIGIHAYHSGKYLQYLTGTGKRYSVVLGGTDVNSDKFRIDSSSLQLMVTVLSNAHHIIAFGHFMVRNMRDFYPEVDISKIKIIPSAVSVFTSDRQFSFNAFENTSVHAIDHYLCIVAGLRPIKDIGFIIHDFAKLFETHKVPDLVIIGPILDETYAEKLVRDIEHYNGIHYIGQMSLEKTHVAIKNSVCLINCSISEGHSQAILEAMMLRTPVVVRFNEGNVDIVDDNETGLIFSTPSEFCNKILKLLQSPTFQNELTNNAWHYVTSAHSLIKECESYNQLITY